MTEAGETDDEDLKTIVRDLVLQQRKTARWMRYMPTMAMSQILLGAPAFVISIFVAYSAFVQADATRKMQAASVWPELQVVMHVDAAAATSEIILENSGIGPARTRNTIVTLDGVEMRTWTDVLRAMRLEEAHASDFENGVTLRAGDALEMLRLEDDPRALPVAAAYDAGRLLIEICYCSVMDDCWTVRSDRDDPQKRLACPPPTKMTFDHESVPTVLEPLR